jgi:hypothetical protein
MEKRYSFALRWLAAIAAGMAALAPFIAIPFWIINPQEPSVRFEWAAGGLLYACVIVVPVAFINAPDLENTRRRFLPALCLVFCAIWSYAIPLGASLVVGYWFDADKADNVLGKIMPAMICLWFVFFLAGLALFMRFIMRERCRRLREIFKVAFFFAIAMFAIFDIVANPTDSSIGIIACHAFWFLPSAALPFVAFRLARGLPRRNKIACVLYSLALSMYVPLIAVCLVECCERIA